MNIITLGTLDLYYQEVIHINKMANLSGLGQVVLAMDPDVADYEVGIGKKLVARGLFKNKQQSPFLVFADSG